MKTHHQQTLRVWDHGRQGHTLPLLTLPSNCSRVLRPEHINLPIILRFLSSHCHLSPGKKQLASWQPGNVASSAIYWERGITLRPSRDFSSEVNGLVPSSYKASDKTGTHSIVAGHCRRQMPSRLRRSCVHSLNPLMTPVVPKVVSLAPALNIFHPGYGEDFFLETQDCLTVDFVGISVSLPSTLSGPLLITILTV